jgi:sugar phosphate isomerase/epimerase
MSMSWIRVAIPTAVYRQPLRQAIQRAAAAGADGVQFDLRQEVTPAEFGETARQQLRHSLEELNLAVAACTFPTQGTLVDPDRLDARVAAIQRCLEFTRQLGADVLTVRLGPIPAADDAAARDRLLDVLNDLAASGNRVGARLAVSTLGNSAAALRELASHVDAGPFGLDFDPAGFIFAGESPPRALTTLHDLVAHVQIRDGLRTPEGGGVETAIGAGEVPWDELLATLAECESPPWLTVRRTGGDDPAADVARGVQYVRNVAAG